MLLDVFDNDNEQNDDGCGDQNDRGIIRFL